MDINEITEEIEKLEKCEYTTYGNCYKLAMLYIVKDHFPKEKSSPNLMKKVNTTPKETAMMANEMTMK